MKRKYSISKTSEGLPKLSDLIGTNGKNKQQVLFLPFCLVYLFWLATNAQEY